jgi:hypothetical protein
MAALVALAALYFMGAPNRPSSPVTGPAVAQPAPAGADFVGAAACKSCHEKEYQAWHGSHHRQSMQEATADTVLGDFNNAKLRHFNVETTFFKRDGKFMVRTDGPDGKLTDYEIGRTFGVWPLQQYMIAFPGGRYQMLGIAWDARTKAEGGQRWFHLYPDEKMDHKDPLHWTGRYQNWNLQCAACHSTHLKKGYDAASDGYKTTFSEINVACEACHGPASRHTDWAKQARAPYPPDSDKGLVVLRSRWNEAWSFATPGAPTAQRDRPADEAAANTCAACHARRSTLVEHGTPGAPLMDTHRPALLTQPAFFADGQQRDEDFVWNSFLQTRMHQKGVTCMDCHDAHSLKLRLEGQHPVRALPQRRRVRHPQAPRAQGREQRRPVRRMPHARAQLHGGGCPARPCHPRAAPGLERHAGHPQRLHPLPRRPQAAMGRSGHGRVVRHRLACTATDRQHPARRRDPGRVRPALAHGAGGRSRPGADRAGDRADTGTTPSSGAGVASAAQAAGPHRPPASRIGDRLARALRRADPRGRRRATAGRPRSRRARGGRPGAG